MSWNSPVSHAICGAPVVYTKCIVRSAQPLFPPTTYAAVGLCELLKWVKCSDENVPVCCRIGLV